MSITDNKGFFPVFASQSPAAWLISHSKIKAFVKAHEKAVCFVPFSSCPKMTWVYSFFLFQVEGE